MKHSNTKKMSEIPRITVVGGGVSGIGTALAILKRIPNCKLTVYSKDFSPFTTGDGSAGLLKPVAYGGTPEDKMLKWTCETWDLFKTWKRRGMDWVLPQRVTTINQDEVAWPEWRNIYPDFRGLSQPELKEYGSQYTTGFTFTTLVAPPSEFLPRLMADVLELGGKFRTRKIYSLLDLENDADIIVNCTGIGALELTQDRTMYPVRGQMVRVDAPWINFVLFDETEDQLTYIIKNPSCIILGGTAQKDDWRTDLDSNDSRDILRKTSQLIPSLKGAEIIEEWAGLRPVRQDGVRLEKDHVQSKSKIIPVVHNYGHGGSGVTFFWGCAQEAAQHTADIVNQKYFPISKL